ncbi:unnamed protein product [Calicophoron daubneyi]|uniref:Retinol dehydrogenase 12 n=1 Tax=Calicophoron daubneyi TaxID=300641 RepID=A0AAV2TXE0_CALDB
MCIIHGRLDDKLAIVSGANAGIGEATVAELARGNAVVIMACRNRDKAEAAKDQILNLYGVSNSRSVEINVADPAVKASLSPIKPEQLQKELLDLGNLQSVRNFADRFKQAHGSLDYLINNAAIMQSAYGKTVDSHEKVIGVNYLGHFLLTELLLLPIKKATSSRIIFFSSDMHRLGKLHKPDLHIPPAEYGGLKSYRQSKLAVAICAAELGRKLTDCGVVAVSAHPGNVRTDLNQGLTTLGFHTRVFFSSYRYTKDISVVIPVFMNRKSLGFPGV